MTEAEAKQRWCPFAMTVTRTTSANRMFGGTIDEKVEEAVREQTRCLGSECMAWRWVGEDDDYQGGYCGLAGKP